MSEKVRSEQGVSGFCVAFLKARYSCQVKNALRVVFELVDSDKSGHLVRGCSDVLE